DAGLPIRGPEGYLIAYAVAADNLSLGRDVIADSVNPLAITRNAWRDVAERCNSGFVEIEVTCFDAAVHRSRVEARSTDIPISDSPRGQKLCIVNMSHGIGLTSSSILPARAWAKASRPFGGVWRRTIRRATPVNRRR